MYLRMLIFFSVSDWSESLDFSTSSFSARYDSSAARPTRAENSTVCCPSSAAIDWGPRELSGAPEIYHGATTMEARAMEFQGF